METLSFEHSISEFTPCRGVKSKLAKRPPHTIFQGMITVLEIGNAIEQLPEIVQRRLAGWFKEHHLIVESSAILGSIYDDEDGGESQLCEA